MKRFRILWIVFFLILFSACSGEDTSQGTSQFVPPTTSHYSSAVTLPTTLPTYATQPTEQMCVVSYMPKMENNNATYTGLAVLPAISYWVTDPDNLRGLSITRVDYSFGAASNGLPHNLTVDNQNRFDLWGTDGLAWDAITQEKVLYLTFDCGYEYENLTSVILDILQEKDIPATFFCTLTYLRSSPQVVSRMIAEGYHVGNHSQTHPEDPAALSREEIAMEVLAVENHLRVNFGYTARYFRFPSGIYSENAVELVSSLGYRSVFWSIAYADWDPANQQGTAVALQTLKERLHPGAVILLHTTSSDNAQILAEFIDYAISQGYRFADLDQYTGWN